MKRFSALLSLLFIAAALFAQEAKEVDVKYVQNQAGPYESIILQGNLTHQLDWDEFILSDGTGSVKVELEGPAKYEMSQNLMGATVRVYGVVDKDHQWDNAEVKALKIRVVGQAQNQPAANQPAASAGATSAAPATASAGDEVNMQGRDDVAEAFEGAFGHHGGPAANIPDNF